MNGPLRWRPIGRSPVWRAALATAGTVFTVAGIALIVWPQLLAYAVAGGFLLLGAILLLSAFAARGLRR